MLKSLARRLPLVSSPDVKTPADISMTARYTAAVWDSINLPFADKFVDRRGRMMLQATNFGSKVLPRGIASAHIDGGVIPRHLFMDEWLKTNGFQQIVEVASGFSPRGLMFSESGVRYIEVDRPRVIADKRRFCRGLPYQPHFLAVDATAPEFVDKVAEACDPALKTAIVNEGMSPYFSRENYLDVLENFRRLAIRLNAKLITDFYRAPRNDKLVGTWFDLGKKAIKLVADEVYLYAHTEDDVRALFEEAGWIVDAIHLPATDARYTLGRVPAVKDWLFVVEARAL